MPSRGSWEDLVWRFHPASDDDVEVLLSRDTDCRLGQRETAAVERWLAGDRDFHIMRDHPEHHAPILGGMWGVRAGMLSAMREDLRDYKPGNYWQADQDFLRAVVYPKVKDHCLVHDEFYGGEPFPTPREDSEFVGQPFDENDRRSGKDANRS